MRVKYFSLSYLGVICMRFSFIIVVNGQKLLYSVDSAWNWPFIRTRKCTYLTGQRKMPLDSPQTLVHLVSQVHEHSLESFHLVSQVHEHSLESFHLVSQVHGHSLESFHLVSQVHEHSLESFQLPSFHF